MTSFFHYKHKVNFSDAQGQLTPWLVVRSCRNSNSSKILCISSKPASLNSNLERVVTPILDAQWQLTQSVVGSGQISKTSKLLCLSLKGTATLSIFIRKSSIKHEF